MCNSLQCLPVECIDTVQRKNVDENALCKFSCCELSLGFTLSHKYLAQMFLVQNLTELGDLLTLILILCRLVHVR